MKEKQKKHKKVMTLNELGNMMSFVVEHMATKEDIADVRKDIADIREELKDIKARLKDIEEAVKDHAGHSKEIDHALERIAAIERHLGIHSEKNKSAA